MPAPCRRFPPDATTTPQQGLHHPRRSPADRPVCPRLDLDSRPMAAPPRAKEGWLTLKERQLGVAAVCILAAIVLVHAERWPFRRLHNHPAGRTAHSFTGAILTDRITLGFLRLAIVAFALFVFVSVPALMLAGRWAKGIGTAGVTVDDAEQAKESLKELQGEIDTLTVQLDRVTSERDRYRSSARRLLSDQRKLFDDQAILPPREAGRDDPD